MDDFILQPDIFILEQDICWKCWTLVDCRGMCPNGCDDPEGDEDTDAAYYDGLCDAGAEDEYRL